MVSALSKVCSGLPRLLHPLRTRKPGDIQQSSHCRCIVEAATGRGCGCEQTSADEAAGQPAEVATTYVRLADPLSSYVSGATIAVTGGKPILKPPIRITRMRAATRMQVAAQGSEDPVPTRFGWLDAPATGQTMRRSRLFRTQPAEYDRSRRALWSFGYRLLLGRIRKGENAGANTVGHIAEACARSPFRRQSARASASRGFQACLRHAPGHRHGVCPACFRSSPRRLRPALQARGHGRWRRAPGGNDRSRS